MECHYYKYHIGFLIWWSINSQNGYGAIISKINGSFFPKYVMLFRLHNVVVSTCVHVHPRAAMTSPTLSLSELEITITSVAVQ